MISNDRSRRLDMGDTVLKTKDMDVWGRAGDSKTYVRTQW